eukprot:scaffold32256_cov69-Phaeocystis_antarctica.AAC.9
MPSFYHFTIDSYRRANSPYTPLFPPTSPIFPSHPDTASLTSLIYRHRFAAATPRRAPVARLLPLAHALLVHPRVAPMEIRAPGFLASWFAGIEWVRPLLGGAFLS